MMLNSENEFYGAIINLSCSLAVVSLLLLGTFPALCSYVIAVRRDRYGRHCPDGSFKASLCHFFLLKKEIDIETTKLLTYSLFTPTLYRSTKVHLEGKGKRKNASVLLCNPCVNGR